MSNRILVVGATGNVGHSLVEKLTAQDFRSGLSAAGWGLGRWE